MCKDKLLYIVLYILCGIAVVASIFFIYKGIKYIQPEREYKEVEVSVVDKYYKAEHTSVIYNAAAKALMTVKEPAIYKITVKYDNKEYVLEGKSIYNKYHNRIGDTVIGTLEIRTYKHGGIEYNIVDLKDKL